MGPLSVGRNNARAENVFGQWRFEGSSTVNKMGEVAKSRAVTIASMCMDTKQILVVIEKRELSPGVHLGPAVTEVRNGRVLAPILNATETDFVLPREFKPRLSALSKFENLNLGLIAQVREYDETGKGEKDIG